MDFALGSKPSTPTTPTDSGEPKIHIVTQDECFKHVFRRTKERSTIYERPERLRFVNLGLAAALAWDSLHHSSPASLLPLSAITNEPNTSSPLVQTPLVTFTKTSRKIAPHDPVLAKIHDQPNRPPSPDSNIPSYSQNHTDRFASFRLSSTYIEQLIGLCHQASELNLAGLSEVPAHLPQGDLYLSAGSEAAILGSIGACYTAIDSVLKPAEPKVEASRSSNGQKGNWAFRKAFVNVRPPGHHCTNSEPMGFCWVNNVLIGCMYSYLTYGIDRICLVDIDLHHGNGSQDIVWRINEQAASQPNPSGKRSLMISYSSLHDINSYPCEDGDPARIKEASLNICVGNAINQFIQNLHLQDWSNEHDFFDRLYPSTWQAFEQHMSSFFRISDADPDRSLIFVSAGFDACEHESEDMSRYAKKLPTSFFHRFARDISRFSEAHCRGRLISVLEGGYSERALIGSSLSYMLGLLERPISEDRGEPAWGAERLDRLVRLCKRGESGRRGQTKSLEDPEGKEAAWLAETRRIFEAIDGYGQVQNELKSVARREQKLRLLQHNLGILQVRNPDGPRRSQRHASAPKLTVPPSSPPKHPQPSSPRPIPPLPSESSDHSSPLTSGPESSTLDEDDDHYDEGPTPAAKQAGASIDSLFSNLQLGSHSHSSSSSEPPPPSPQVSSPIPQHHPPLPKVKLVWKAGGIFPSARTASFAPEATDDKPDPPPDNLK